MIQAIMGNNDREQFRDKSDHDLLVELNTRFINFETALKNKVDSSDFTPVKLIVYGFTGILLTSAILALCSVIYRSAPK
jgi:hypothetical protein